MIIYLFLMAINNTRLYCYIHIIINFFRSVKISYIMEKCLGLKAGPLHKLGKKYLRRI